MLSKLTALQYKKCFLIFTCFLFVFGCRKDHNATALPAENIKLSEITQWNNWYEKTIPNAPKLLINKAEKTFFQNQFYIRVPIQGSKGMMYFAKDQSLEAEFIRISPDKEPVSFPFTGSYEFINMNAFTYQRMAFIDGNLGKIFKGNMINPVNENPNSSIKTNNSWLSQLLTCIGLYIIAVPAKDPSGDWTSCWALGGSMNQGLEATGEAGGGTPPINWSSFFLNINPPSTGPDPIPPTGGDGSGSASWTLVTPPYSGPSVPADPWNGINQLVGNNDLETNASLESLYYIIYKFPINNQYENQYPKFYSLVKNIYSKALQTPLILNCLKTYSHMSDAQLYAALKWNSGPTVSISDINTNYSGPHRYGYFNARENKNVINIEQSDVVSYENAAPSSSQENAWLFMIMVTLFHETIHYGNNQVGFIEKYEFGDGWEVCVYGERIDDYNTAVKFILQKQ